MKFSSKIHRPAAVLGYGANGAGPIGPNETLIFVVDLVAVK
jgi:peptidylprolyl isomerase